MPSQQQTSQTPIDSRDEWRTPRFVFDYMQAVLEKGSALQAATIADLRERHEAFVRKVWEVVGTPTALPDCDLLDKVLVLCSAELGKEN